MCKFPNVEVQLSGEDSNAFFIIGRITKAMRIGGATKQDIEDFRKEAMSGNYDHVIQTAMATVTVK